MSICCPQQAVLSLSWATFAAFRAQQGIGCGCITSSRLHFLPIDLRYLRYYDSAVTHKGCRPHSRRCLAPPGTPLRGGSDDTIQLQSPLNPLPFFSHVDDSALPSLRPLFFEGLNNRRSPHCLLECLSQPAPDNMCQDLGN